MIKGNHYCISGENLPGHEIIGLEARVVKSSDASKAGISGKVVDETRNTVTVETHSGEKVLGKKEVWLEFRLKNETALVAGQAIEGRPEDRTKNWWRKK